MIELKEVTKEYSKGVAALNGINLKIEQGELCCSGRRQWVRKVNSDSSDDERTGTYVWKYCSKWTESGETEA